MYVYALESTCTYKDDGMYVGVGVRIHTYIHTYISVLDWNMYEYAYCTVYVNR